MSESKWLAERRNPQGMVGILRQLGKAPRTKLGRRKLRLVACGCCRMIWDHLSDLRLRNAVETAERFADGKATKVELEAAGNAIEPMKLGSYLPQTDGVQDRTAAALASYAADESPVSSAFGATSYILPLAGFHGSPQEESETICDLFRDIFGNPFRPAAFDPACRTSTAIAMANGMYESRDFSPMPILADALQDAGCDNDDVLNHCREASGIHVRGCWVVDLVLGKS